MDYKVTFSPKGLSGQRLEFRPPALCRYASLNMPMPEISMPDMPTPDMHGMCPRLIRSHLVFPLPDMLTPGVPTARYAHTWCPHRPICSYALNLSMADAFSA